MIFLLIFLGLLVAIFLIIYRNEYWIKKINAPDGKIEGYWASRERRNTVRLEIPLEVKYTCLPPYNHNHLSVTQNISQGGIQLLIYEKLNIDDRLDLELELSNNEHPIIGMGQIAWLKDAPFQSEEKEKRAFLAGIKFIDLKPKDEKRLNDFICSKCKK